MKAELLAAAEALAGHRIFLFFLHDAHFLNPLVPHERQRLAGFAGLDDPAVHELVVRTLPDRAGALAPGIYFPIPLCRALAEGRTLDEALESYRYELVQVDENQVWWWRQRRVAPRVQGFFLEHLSYEPSLDRYQFEYKVHDSWWDKCYLEAAITPMLGRRITPRGEELRIELNNGQSDRIALDSLRLDERERLLCRSRRHGEVLLSDWARFELLKGVSEDCRSVRVGELVLPLAWTNGPPPG